MNFETVWMDQHGNEVDPEEADQEEIIYFDLREGKSHVDTFDHGDEKEKALKPLEEAAEVFSAWQHYQDLFTNIGHPVTDTAIKARRQVLLLEIADTIQSCMNLAKACGIDDMGPYLRAVETKNRDRGYYD